MSVDQLLEISFLAIASKSLNDFATLENKDGWDSCDPVLDGEIHVLGDVDFSNFGVSVVIGRQLINDWTQSFAWASAVGIEINQYRCIRTEHVGLECVGCKFCRHVFSCYLSARLDSSSLW